MRAVWFLLVLCLSGVVPAQAASRILVMGDSLSAAYGMSLTQGWVSLLQQRLDDRGYKYQVVNGSISGETSRGGLQRLSSLLETHRPALVLIELGGNDGLRALPVSALQDNLAEMIRRSRAAGARVLLFEMRIPDNYGARYTQAFNAVYHELARTTQVTLVPFFLEGIAREPRYFLPDGIHPSAAAQPLLLAAVWPSLSPWLRRP